MNLPLHKNAQGVTQISGDFHAGLWFDRFFNRYDNNWKVPDGGKLEWINTVAGSVGNSEKLTAFESRQNVLIKGLDGKSVVMDTDWHFVTGMGNNHPVENGFAWHPTLGVPYLTGAAVKGMVRGYCEAWADEKVDLQKWFGGDGDKQAGEIIFFDAVPIRPVKLKADIMTPHYGDWYAKGDQGPNRDGSNVPADWHDPVPVPFLVVDKGQSFQFGVALRAGSDVELPKVIEALTQALAWIGAGAKTAAGYGRMVIPKELEKSQMQAKHEAAHTRQSRPSVGLSPAKIAKQKLAREKLAAQLAQKAKQPAAIQQSAKAANTKKNSVSQSSLAALQDKFRKR